MIELFAAIWRVSARRQVVLILLSAVIAALAAVPLDYQKDIVNGLTDAALDRDGLMALCAGMMGFILLSLALKWVLGLFSSTLGEDTIRLIRNRICAGASARARQDGARVATGPLATMVASEAEDLGKFVGGAFADPVLQIGTLISVTAYIAASQPALGLIALCTVAPQVALVLATQGRINAEVAERIRLLRRATDTITTAEVAALAEAVAADFDAIYDARRSMFLWKLSTKFLLSALNGAGTVAVLLLGGWAVLNGRTDVGTVVAAISGLSRLQGPSTFLIAYYRQVSATRVKLDLLMDAARPTAEVRPA